MEPKKVNIRGQIVPLHRASHLRGFNAYQGGDYFEFRHDDDTDRWLMSQSAEDRLHDPAHVVACGVSVQDAANDFTVTRHRHAEDRAYVPTATQGCDLATASIDLLVLVLGEVTRLGYLDERQGHPRRTAHQIGDVLGLTRWNGLQQLQLCHAYKAGREHLAVERIQDIAR
jgi:hypothetical protein